MIITITIHKKESKEGVKSKTYKILLLLARFEYVMCTIVSVYSDLILH